MAKYRRGIFLINKRFQIRFAIYVSGWLVALSFVYPLIIYNLFKYFLEYVQTLGAPIPVWGFDEIQRDVILLLVLFQLLFLGLSFLISIYMSHRIAGPLYKLSKYFKAAEKGAYQDDLLFRKADHFKELADDFNIMMRSIRGAVEKKSDAVLTAIPKLEEAAKKASPELKTEIESVLASLREARD